MKNKFTLTISLLLLCLLLLACNFSGAKSGDEKKPIIKTEKDLDKKSKTGKRNPQDDGNDKNKSSEKTNELGKDEFKKLEIWECRGKVGHVLIPGKLSREELVELALKIHNDEWETGLFLVDDEAGAENHIRFMKQICKGEADKSTFPHEWADRHIIATIQRGSDATWDLYEGSQKRIWLEWEFDEMEKTKIADLYYK